MMSVEQDFARVRAIIADAIDVDEDMLKPDAHFIKEIGLDSLVSLEILVRLEREFKIKISEAELPRLTTLRTVVDLLKSKQAF